MGYFNKSRMAIFKELLDHEKFTNATLVTEDGGHFKVHLEVLSGKSLYIRRPLENETVSQEILIPGVSRGILEKVINYIYTDKLIPTDDNVTHLMDAAQQLGVLDILQLCKSYLGENLKLENCLTRLNLASRYLYIDLKETVKKFILANFEEVSLKLCILIYTIYCTFLLAKIKYRK